jgi:hypothetical protein
MRGLPSDVNIQPCVAESGVMPRAGLGAAVGDRGCVDEIGARRRLWSGVRERGCRWWEPWLAGDRRVESVKGIDAVFDRGRGVAADGQAGFGGVIGGESARNLLLGLCGPQARSAWLFVAGIVVS